MKHWHTRLALIATALMACAPLAMAAGPQNATQDAMRAMHDKQAAMQDKQAAMQDKQAAMQEKRAAMQDKQRKTRMDRHHRMMGVHRMPGTVTSVDHATGIVKLDSMGMPLVVHFPPGTIKDLKAGDTIRLLLGYRKTGR